MNIVKALIIGSLVFLTGCNPSTAQNRGGEEMKLAVYQVPDGFQEELADVINHSFAVVADQSSQRSMARVEVLPNGDLALLGPTLIHAGFEQLIEEVSKRRPTGPNNASIDCWVVMGLKSGDDRGDNLDELKPAIDQLRAGGVRAFKLLEKFRLSSSMGARATTTGKYFQFSQNLAMLNGRVISDLNISGIRGVVSEMETRLHLKPEKFVIIGEATFSYGANVEKNESLWEGVSERTPSLYYIIRATFSGDAD